MARLLDLANELLLSIIEVLRVEEIEAFTSCNKRIHSLSQSVLQEHRAMKTKYSKVRLTSCARDTLDVRKDVHPLVWLQEVILDERAALYPTHIYVEGLEEDSDDVDVRHYCTTAAMKDLVCSKLEQCPYVQREVLEEWKQVTNDVNSFDIALALLLTLLPNLQSFAFEWCYESLPRTRYMVASIAKASLIDRKQTHALSRLISLDHPFQFGSILPLEFFLPFTGLPSVRSLSGDKVDDWEIEDFWLPSTQDSIRDTESVLKMSESGTTHIKFSRSNIACSRFEDLLCRMSALQELEYEHAGYWLAFEPAKIVNSLLAHAGHSLCRLDLTAQKDCVRHWYYSPGLVFMGSLRDFRVLKIVRVNTAFFVERIINLDADKEGSCKVHPMVDLLPESIEKLSLVGNLDFCSSNRKFDDLMEFKAYKLPKLEVIELDSFYPVAFSLRRAYRQVGVKLEFGVTS